MIQLAHLAVGALAARGRSGPLAALLAGIASHAAIDVPPHGEVHDDAFEAATATIGVLALAARHGVMSPITWGALGGVLPDLEHVLPRRIRPRRAVFPTHRYAWTHGDEGLPLRVPAWAQAVLGGAVLGVLVAARVAEAAGGAAGADRDGDTT